jgi:iron complex transport system substrate-binding protein
MMLAGNWVPDLIEIAGGTCELVKPALHSAYVPWEAVARWDPEIVVIAACGFDLTRTLQEASTLRELSGWKDLTAVRSGRVFAVDGNAYFNRSGPRLVDSLKLLAHLVHPELFDKPDLGREQVWTEIS